MIKGTRLRHINGNDLNALEQSLEKANHKVEIKAITYKPSGEWYIHFTILDDINFRVQNEADSVNDQEIKKVTKKRNKK
jgi:hypothetical protein